MRSEKDIFSIPNANDNDNDNVDPDSGLAEAISEGLMVCKVVFRNLEEKRISVEVLGFATKQKKYA